MIVSFPFGKKYYRVYAHRICNLNISIIILQFNIKNETFIYKTKYNSRDEFKHSGEPDCCMFSFCKKINKLYFMFKVCVIGLGYVGLPILICQKNLIQGYINKKE